VLPTALHTCTQTTKSLSWCWSSWSISLGHTEPWMMELMEGSTAQSHLYWAWPVVLISYDIDWAFWDQPLYILFP
jgi:hypothetical protein